MSYTSNTWKTSQMKKWKCPSKPQLIHKLSSNIYPQKLRRNRRKRRHLVCGPVERVPQKQLAEMILFHAQMLTKCTHHMCFELDLANHVRVFLLVAFYASHTREWWRGWGSQDYSSRKTRDYDRILRKINWSFHQLSFTGNKIAISRFTKKMLFNDTNLPRNLWYLKSYAQAQPWQMSLSSARFLFCSQ